MLAYLRDSYADAPGTLLRSEMGLNDLWRRADLVVFGDDFVGYEIKSDVDSLKRLPGQAAAFSQVFDRVVVVVTHTHLRGALAIVPEWWGVLVATRQDRYMLARVEIEVYRQPETNPELDHFAMLKILWVAEMTAELKIHNLLPRGHRSKPTKHFLIRHILDVLPPDVIREVVHRRLKSRMIEQHTPTLVKAS